MAYDAPLKNADIAACVNKIKFLCARRLLIQSVSKARIEAWPIAFYSDRTSRSFLATKPGIVTHNKLKHRLDVLTTWGFKALSHCGYPSFGRVSTLRCQSLSKVLSSFLSPSAWHNRSPPPLTLASRTSFAMAHYSLWVAPLPRLPLPWRLKPQWSLR